MNAARTKLTTTATVDGRHARGLFLEWSAGLDKTMKLHFDATMKKLNDNKTAGFWFKEISHETKEDRYVYDHSFRVAELALMLAKEMGLCQIMLTNIHRGAYLHDIGKLGILSSILEKNEKLTQDEYIMICRHPEMGSNILEKFENLCEFKEIVRHHHERYDGKGYPDGLKGMDISVEARIVAVADAFDAMTGPRAYRTTLSVSEAIQEMEHCSGSQFDPEIVKILKEIVIKVDDKSCLA